MKTDLETLILAQQVNNTLLLEQRDFKLVATGFFLMAEKVVVAGAGFGGINAALELARKGFEVEIIDKESFSEYKPGLIDLFRDRIEEDKLKLNLGDFFENTSIDFSREKILGFNLDQNKVETDSGSHEYDYLVLALGSEPATYGMDISDAELCYDIREL